MFPRALKSSPLTERPIPVAVLGFGPFAVAIPAVLALSAEPTIQLAILSSLAFMLALVVLGVQRVALGCLCAAFALMPLNALRVTEWLTFGDLALVLAIVFGALSSGWVFRRISLPTVYVAGCAILLLAGLMSSFLTGDLQSLLNLARLVIAAVALPFLASLWRPSCPSVQLLAVCYLLGQSVSVLYGLLTPVNVYTERAQGLTLHPNDYGLAAALAMGLAAFLFLSGTARLRLFSVSAGLLAGAGLVQSGSRAALLAALAMAVAAALINRAWKLSAIGSLAIAAAVLAQDTLLSMIPSGSALHRLLGDDSAQAADVARLQALTADFDSVLANPIFGRGFADSLEAHNILLQVASAAGIFGLVGFLCVMYAAVRPLLRADLGLARWLALPPLGYLVAGMVSNILWSRYVWILIALAVVGLWQSADGAERKAAEPLSVGGAG